MGPNLQILLGTGLLGASTVLHVISIANCVPMLIWLAARLPGEHRPRLRLVVLVLLSVAVLVLSHTVQVWGWAIVFNMISNLPSLVTSFYFSTVTYTTLGYGDIVLGPDARIVATFCAVTGLLTFGLSTAFLFGVLTNVLPRDLGREQGKDNGDIS